MTVNVVSHEEAKPDPERGSQMKRNPRNRTKFQMRPLKIDLTEAEILADLHYGVGKDPRQERAARRGVATR
mgnify:CR=1 FL=1